MSDIIPPADTHFAMMQKRLTRDNARRQRRLSRTGWAARLAALDLVGLGLIAAVASQLCVQPPRIATVQVWTGIGYFTAAWVLTSWGQGLYTDKVIFERARIHIFHGLMTCILAFGAVLLAGVALNWRTETWRVWLLTWAIGAVVWIGGIRLLWSYFVLAALRRGASLDRALVVADSRVRARHLGDRIESESRGKIAIVGAVAFPGTPDGVPIDWVEETIRDGDVDRVVITGFGNIMDRATALLERLACVSVDVTIIPDLAELRVPVRNVDCIGMLPAIDLASRPLTAIDSALKRAEDVVLGCLLGLVVAPVALLIALAIKIDSPGPVLFGQLREGYHGRVFKIWKFRTMYHGAPNGGTLAQTSRNDSRVTRLGQILRRFSLDELPQFLNVIRGDMSLVGPRPHAVGMTSLGVPMTEVINKYPARHRLKPGITGWAQVNGCRGEIDCHEKLCRRVLLDCYYIDHWSIALDLQIIFLTLTRLPFDPGAY